MKKNIIMVIIILICSMSLLLVLYYFNSKNIYYISDKIIGNNEITMQIKSGSTYTNLETLNDLDSSKYYRISSETSCSSGTASFYYSNSTNKLKVKVTNNPLKCKIVFEEIVEDINILSLTLNNIDIDTVPTTGGPYSINYDCKNIDGSSNNAIIEWNNSTYKLETKNITTKTYCEVDFHNETYSDTWKIWAQRAGINPNEYNSFQTMMNNTNIASIIINNQFASDYLVATPALVTSLKALTNYESEIVPILLETRTINSWNRYASSLPYYAVNGLEINIISGLYLYGYSSTATVTGITRDAEHIGLTSSYSDNTGYFASVNNIVTNGYNKIKYDFYMLNSYNNLTCTLTFGIKTVLANDNAYVGTYITKTINNTKNVRTYYSEIINISPFTERQNLKFTLYHGTEAPEYTCYAYFSKIAIY